MPRYEQWETDFTLKCPKKCQKFLNTEIWVCFYHMTISLFPVKVKISSLLSHRTNRRHNTLDLTKSKQSKYCLLCQRF